jgi:hypothetical protein
MTMTKLDDSGGTFSTADFTVYPVLVFTRVSDGVRRTLDLGSPTLRALLGNGIKFKAKRAPWQRGCRGPALINTRLNREFCPALGRKGQKKLNQEQAMLAAHGVKPAQPPKLPPVDCGMPPPGVPNPIPVPQGNSINATCPLERPHEFIDSFFDVFVTLQPENVPAGLNVSLNPSPTTLAYQQTKTVTITVGAGSNAAVGTHTVPVKLTESAGGYTISSFFDIFVDVKPSPPVACTGALTFQNPTHTIVQAQFSCNQGITEFVIAFNGVTQAQGQPPPGATFSCTTETQHQNTIDCSGPTIPANTQTTVFALTNPAMTAGAGAPIAASTGTGPPVAAGNLTGP